MHIIQKSWGLTKNNQIIRYKYWFCKSIYRFWTNFSKCLTELTEEIKKQNANAATEIATITSDLFNTSTKYVKLFKEVGAYDFAESEILIREEIANTFEKSTENIAKQYLDAFTKSKNMFAYSQNKINDIINILMIIRTYIYMF